MNDYFGTVIFSRPLVLVSDLPAHITWYTRRTLSGKLVYIYYSNGTEVESETMPNPYVAEWEFTRQSRSVIKRLRWLWNIGREYPFRLDSIQGTGCLDPDGGVSGIAHFSGKRPHFSATKNTVNDQWNGRIKLLVSRSSVTY